MEVVEVKLRDEYIKLGQALKAAHVVGSGVDAKFLIQDGKVTVNGQVKETSVASVSGKIQNMQMSANSSLSIWHVRK